MRQEKAKDFQDGGCRDGKVIIGNLMSVEDTRNNPRTISTFIEAKAKAKREKDRLRQETEFDLIEDSIMR